MKSFSSSSAGLLLSLLERDLLEGNIVVGAGAADFDFLSSPGNIILLFEKRGASSVPDDSCAPGLVFLMVLVEPNFVSSN
jgi:hypothetical protein